MKNIHTIYYDWDRSKIRIIEKFGITVEPGFNRIVIEEDQVYNGLKSYFDNWQVKDYVVSKFTKEEEDNAKRLVYAGVWANGYPMNDYDRSYLKTTYNDSNFCNTCGMGLIQKEPFRLKRYLIGVVIKKCFL